MSAHYRDRDGDVWLPDAEQGGYFTGDMHTTVSLDDLRAIYGPLGVREGSVGRFVPEGESPENLLRRIICEELDRRFGKVEK
ncbi:hypothetical protein [Streptomyces sp. NPDC102264]|uniref:hypothetical protein n=1 Tax=Streptomyces sp. NPDC102264 TaxID=3366149 RepID=UPI0038135939